MTGIGHARASSVRRLGLVPALSVVVACGSDTVADGGADELADGRTLVQIIEPRYRPPRVDVILVIDDSPSMRPFQARWQQNLAAFAHVLEDEVYPADVRLAITTTSVPGPTCAGPRARGGESILDSCRAHLEDFVGPDEHGELGGEVEDLASLCEDACSLSSIPRVLSTGSDEHDLASLALRPWIEGPHNPFGGNLDGVSLTEALTCAGLQGFSGCMFESPIEAAARMVEHLADPTHPMSEFRRPDAALVIVTIGDEDDCSHPDSSATIFDPAGERIFWSDPAAEQPTSAVCINAGLACDEQSCALTDHALDGSPTDDPHGAALTSTDRLRDALDAAGEFDNPPWVPIISNVGGYLSDGSVHYTAPGPELSEGDQTYLENFGVVPGCKTGPNPELRAGPGGRLAEIGTPESQFSICDDDWSPVLESFAQKIKVLYPHCIEFACVSDLDPGTELLEPDCVLEEVDWKGDRVSIPTCERDEAGWVIDPQTMDFVIPGNADACWAWRTDAAGHSEDVHDDAPLECVEGERVGHVPILRRPGKPLPYDSVYQLRCRPCDG